MPLYVYRCKCGEIKEELRSFEDRSKPVKCDKCGGRCKLDEVNDIYPFCANAPGHPRHFRGKREYGSRKRK